MDAIRWQRLETLFLAALDSDDDSRLSMLRRATRDDPTLYDEIAAMLAAHADTGRLGVESLIRDSADDAPARQAAAVDSHVGPYRLLEQIGEGGMGVVYRAERADGQYTQTVAIKLVRSGLVTTELIRRFRSERQILARLEHPGIARLLDGGITDADVPYLVMEHVRGRSITQHCDAERMTVARRLALFRTVCDAVNHAHRNLVVHRDLKPSNILVTADGSVKLLDFGIARLIAPEDADGTVTSTIIPALTPEYASPEQVLGGAITTATDVYALGLLLYELLSGERAQQAAGASLAAIHRTICEEEPRVPSVAVSAGTPREVSARLAARGHVRVERLSRQLRGDLDTIVETALRKDPSRRYASVDQLAGDIDRHLAGLPVLARPDTVRYRTAKFLRRHRVGATAAAAIALSLLAGAAVAFSGMTRARHAERIALDEAAAATSVSAFLVDLFRASDPAEARGDTVTARELLDRGASRVRAQLADQPLVHARLLRTMAQAYESLGLFDSAIPLIEEELEIRKAYAGAESIETGVTLARLSGLFGRTGDYVRARELALEAVAIQERATDPYSRELMDALNTLGSANGRLGDLPAARVSLERSLAIGERTLGPDDLSITGTLNNLAIVRWQEGNPAAAVPLFTRAIAILERERGPDHPSVAHTLNNLALAHNRAGNDDQAVAAHERVLAIRQRILEPDHPDIAETLNNLGVVLLDNGEFLRARPMFERALAIRERALGPDHDHVASTLSNLGFVLLGLGDADAAQPLLERAFASLDRDTERDGLMATYPLLGLARIEHVRGNHDAAERLFRRVIDTREARLGDNHPELAPALRDFARFLRERGRVAEADSSSSRAERIQLATNGGGG